MPEVEGAAGEGVKDDEMRKQISSRRAPDLKTELSTCSLLLVRIRNRQQSCFYSGCV